MRMSRQRKEGQKINILMDANIMEKLEEYCKKTRLTKTAAIEQALEEYFEKRKDILEQ